MASQGWKERQAPSTGRRRIQAGANAPLELPFLWLWLHSTGLTLSLLRARPPRPNGCPCLSWTFGTVLVPAHGTLGTWSSHIQTIAPMPKFSKTEMKIHGCVMAYLKLQSMSRVQQLGEATEIKINQNRNFSFSALLVMFQVLGGHVWPAATILGIIFFVFAFVRKRCFCSGDLGFLPSPTHNFHL